MKKKLSLILAVLMVLVSLSCVACTKDPEQPEAHVCESKCSVCGKCKNASCTEEVCELKCVCGSYKDLSVRSATGSNGVVTSSCVEASKVGYDILKDGGNAYDAAIAMAFALGVAEPNASGVGGGGLMVGYNASTNSFVNYNFREFAPAAATKDKFGTAYALQTGALSIGVPTEVSGLLTIFEECGSGKYTLAQILQPAINLAENGYEVGDRLSSNAQFIWDNELLAGEEALSIYGDASGIRSIKAGKTLVNENYAKVLKAIAENGKDGFYSGWVAQAILQAMADNDGLITQADLDKAKNDYPKKSEPLHGTYNGYDVYTTGLPSGGGAVLLETLNMLEKYAQSSSKALSSYTHNSAEYMHLVGTALQISYADKRHYVADIDNVPMAGLISKDYAAERIKIFDTTKPFIADAEHDYGGACGVDPFDYCETKKTTSYKANNTNDNGTTAFSVVDGQGNVVTFTKTINGYWGSYIMPKGTGFFLNNELADFAFEDDSVNVVAPNKQPTSSIAPAIVLKDGKPVLTVACPGGIVIPTAVAQVIVNVLDFNMDIQTAIETARIQNLYVSDSDKFSMGEGQSITTHKLFSHEENGMPADVKSALEAMGYVVVESATGVTHVYGISISYDGDNKSMTGGADIRRDGKSLAY